MESERTRLAREKLTASLKAASPETRKALKEALEETRQHFQKPEVIQELVSTIGKMKDAFDSGKIKEITERFKEKYGLSGDTKLTDEMRRKLAEELADGILGKK
jgi:hypothetical protein